MAEKISPTLSLYQLLRPECAMLSDSRQKELALPHSILLEAEAQQHILTKQLNVGCQQSDIRMQEHKKPLRLHFLECTDSADPLHLAVAIPISRHLNQSFVLLAV